MSEISLEQCYQLLDLQPGASVNDIEAAYAKKVLEKVRQGARADKQLLNQAYHQLKDYTLLQAVPVQPDSTGQTVQEAIAHFLQQRLSSKQIQVQVNFKGEKLQIFLQSDQGLNRQLAPFIRTSLKELKLSDIQLSEIKTVSVYGLRENRAIAWKETFSFSFHPEIPEPETTQDDVDPYSFNNRWVNAFSLPVAMLAGWISNQVGLFKLFFTPFHLWTHECGHATVAWLSGHRATPLPFGWTNVGEERSIIVYGCVLALFGLLFWSGWREQKLWTMGLAVALMIIQFYMTWIMPLNTFEMWLAFGGIGGEFCLSTLLMVCFYFPLPERWRWDFWRYIVMLIAASTFFDSFWMWHQIKRGLESIPWGSLFGGEGDSGGDMNRLSLDYGWSDLKIVQTYTQLGNFCLLILLSVYFFFLIKQHRKFIFRRPG